MNIEATVNDAENLIAHYQKALLIKPDSAAVHSKLGEFYTFQGKYEKAPYYYIKSIEFDPGCFQTYWSLKFSIVSLSWYGKTVELSLLNQGIEILKNAAENQPDFPFAYAVLGDLLTQKGNKQEAINCYQMASRNQILLSRPELVSQLHNCNRRSQPSFLILGFMRCGTSSLYDYLIAHPQVLPAIDKELWFFNNFFDQGIDWYLAHFSPLADDVNYLTGEATPLYINSPDVAIRVFDSFPAIKLIVLLRNPVERLISAIYVDRPHSLKNLCLEDNIINGLEEVKSMIRKLPETSLIEPSSLMNWGLAHQDMVLVSHLLNGLYILYLKRWLTIFPRDKFLILRSEDLFNDSLTTMSKVHSFLSLPEHHLSKYHSSNAGSYPSISNKLRYQIAEFYQPYNQQLEDYLDMKFNWK